MSRISQIPKYLKVQTAIRRLLNYHDDVTSTSGSTLILFAVGFVLSSGRMTVAPVRVKEIGADVARRSRQGLIQPLLVVYSHCHRRDPGIRFCHSQNRLDEITSHSLLHF